MAHPISWELQLFSADGSVAAELQHTPHQPLILKGDPSLLTHRSHEISRAIGFFIPQPPFQHGCN
jgi:hypothetical protein